MPIGVPRAHEPLATFGAVALALLATWLGIPHTTVGRALITGYRAIKTRTCPQVELVDEPRPSLRVFTDDDP